jgi:serine/threonine-protein kinase RsbW
MEATISLRLPRDAASVPVIRQMLDSALRIVGVDQPVRDDIQLMLGEACSNVIMHAAPSADYAVSAELFEDRCVINVVDSGGGFAADASSRGPLMSEHGRGLQIMRALADEVRLSNRPGDGAVVCLEKALRYGAGAPARKLHTVHRRANRDRAALGRGVD